MKNAEQLQPLFLHPLTTQVLTAWWKLTVKVVLRGLSKSRNRKKSLAITLTQEPTFSSQQCSIIFPAARIIPSSTDCFPFFWRRRNNFLRTYHRKLIGWILARPQDIFRHTSTCWLIGLAEST